MNESNGDVNNSEIQKISSPAKAKESTSDKTPDIFENIVEDQINPPLSIRTLKTLDPDVYRNEAERNEMSLNESLNGSACLFGTDTETQSQADSAKPITENKLETISEKEQFEIGNVMQSTRQPTQNSQPEGKNEIDTMLDDPILVEDAMKQLAQSTPARQPKSTNQIANKRPDLRKLDIPGRYKFQDKPGEIAKLEEMKKRYKFVIVCSQLKPDQKKMVRRLCNERGGLMSNNVNAITTHLVTGTVPHDDESAILSPRTLKSLGAIAHGIWLLSIDWVELSLNLDSGLADENRFEVNGDGAAGITNAPRRAREYTNKMKIGACPLPIFEKYAIWCQPPFSNIMPKATLYNLFKIVGIAVFEKLVDLNEARKFGLIPIVLMNEKEEGEQSQPLNPNQVTNFMVLDRDWFLDSLCNWNPLPFKQYLANAVK
jgi:hypothetical protein